MKQHITPEQLNELSEKGKKELRKWWKPEVGGRYSWRGEVGFISGNFGQPPFWTPQERYKEECLPILSIGQMIEFLECFRPVKIRRTAEGGWWLWLKSPNLPTKSVDRKELCDALWQAVKEELEK